MKSGSARRKRTSWKAIIMGDVGLARIANALIDICPSERGDRERVGESGWFVF